MLIASLANGNNLIRLIVLKSLININYNLLCFKIGGLLNKRVYIFPFNRDIDSNIDNMNIYLDLLKECKEKKHVALSLPEYCLSFKLKTMEMCRVKDGIEAKKLIEIEKWLNLNAKDMFDESDEILSVKYQLVYSVGSQSILDGGKSRWEVAKNVLNLCKNKIKILKDKKYNDSIEYLEDEDFPQAFPSIRLLNNESYDELKENICHDFFNKIGTDINFVQFTSADVTHLMKFVIEKIIPEETIKKVEELNLTSKSLKDILLILRGILSYDILFSVLNKRWKVDYGANVNGKLLQAVPYRAKDVPAERYIALFN